ncbi:MAG: metallophosphoesterase [Deltaproteobacteria bacterium]|nr:metallophosphoesterase [Deltaproteobacteria bacterium]
MRLAAVGDLHFHVGKRGHLRPHLAKLEERASALLLAGDLTCHGTTAEAEVLAEELRGVKVPVVAVLGNHDYDAGKEGEIRRLFQDVGVVVLEGESFVLDLEGKRLGVVGVKGFGGGFKGACASDFGEPEMKAFIRTTRRVSESLGERLAGLQAECDRRVALLHYSPIPGTLVGERLEIYPFLGSYLLGDAVERGGCDLVIHGHSHRGTKKGNIGEVPVLNVAQPLIGEPFATFTLG